MKRVLITTAGKVYGTESNNSTQIADSDDIAALQAGALACLDVGGNLISPTVPTSDEEEIYFAVGRSSGGALISPMVNRLSLKLGYLAYTAPVAKVMYFGDDSNTGNEIAWPTLTAGHEYGFIVVNLDKPHYDTTRSINFTHVVTTAEAAGTDGALLATIVAEMNANTEIAKICTVAAVNTDDGVSFTSKESTERTGHYVNFTIIPTGQFVGIGHKVEGVAFAADGTSAIIDNVFYSASTVPTLTNAYRADVKAIAHREGHGTAYQVGLEEKEGAVELGWMKDPVGSRQEFWKGDFLTVAGETYDVFILTWETTKTASRKKIDTEGNFRQELAIYVPAGDALVAQLELILNAL